MGIKLLFLAFLSAILLSFALYANTIPGEFVYDDSYFKDRHELASPDYLLKVWGEPYRVGDERQGVYRPLSVMTFAVNFIFFGKGPVSFHIFNIIFNATAVFLAFLVTWQLFRDKTLAIFTALIFAFLPIHTEAVAFIKARDEVLSAIFSLGSISIFLLGLERAGNRRVLLLFLSSLLFFLAVMAKEFAIVLPALTLAIYWIKEKPTIKNLIFTGLIFVPITLAYLLIRWQILKQYAFGSTQTFWYFSPMQYLDFSDRVWTAFKMLFMYIQKTFIPLNLSATHHFNHLTLIENPFASVEAMVGIILALIFVVVLVKKRLRESPVGIGIILFFVPYLVFSKFIFTAGEIFAERWMYFSSFGLSLICGFFLYKLFKYQRWLSIGLLGFVLIFYAAITVSRNTIWLSEKNLYESMLADAPRSAQGYVGLSNLYYKEGDRKKAAEYLAKGQQIYPDHPRLLELEAIFAYNNKDLATAKRALDRAMEVDQNNVDYLFYAIILTEEGEYEKALSIANKYFSLPGYQPNDPANKPIRCLMAINLIRLGRMAEANKYCDLLDSQSQTIRP